MLVKYQKHLTFSGFIGITSLTQGRVARHAESQPPAAVARTQKYGYIYTVDGKSAKSKNHQLKTDITYITIMFSGFSIGFYIP